MAATYRIGSSDFFTPGDLQADARTLNDQVTALDNVISDQVSQDFFDGWQLFLSAWKRFFSDHFSGYFGSLVAALNDGNRDELVSFEQQFVVWAHNAEKQSVIMPGPVIEPSAGTNDGFFNHLKNALGLDSTTLIVVLVLVAAIVVVPRVVGR